MNGTHETTYTIHHREYGGKRLADIETGVTEADLAIKLSAAIDAHGFLRVAASKE